MNAWAGYLPGRGVTSFLLALTAGIPAVILGGGRILVADLLSAIGALYCC